MYPANPTPNTINNFFIILFLSFCKDVDGKSERYDIRNISALSSGTPELSDLYGNAYSVNLSLIKTSEQTFSLLSDETFIENLKLIWIFREWIYRHWDRKPKLISFLKFPKTNIQFDSTGKSVISNNHETEQAL